MGAPGVKIRKPSMERVISLIEAHGGKMHLSEILDILPMPLSSIQGACTNAVNEGFLSKRLVKTGAGRKRRQNEYRRTKKPYAPPPITEKTAKEHARKARERERIEGSQFVPHRHIHDEWLFGAYAKPFVPTITAGRVIRQSMEVSEEMEVV